MLGAIVGDIIGSPYEYAAHNCFSRGKIRPFENNLFCQFTDDTVLTIAIGRALIESQDTEDLEAIKKAASYYLRKYYRRYPNIATIGGSRLAQSFSEKLSIRPEGKHIKKISCYGGRFIDWAKGNELEIEWAKKSDTNGGPMRVSTVGWMYDDLDITKKVARTVTEITHKGDAADAAETLATLIYWARRNKDRNFLIQKVIDSGYGYDVSTDEDRLKLIRKKNKNASKNAKNALEAHFYVSCKAKETFEEALYAFFATNSFKECVITAISLGGDSDTIACMAGAIAEAYYGEMPKDWEHKAYQTLNRGGCKQSDIERIKTFKQNCFKL